MAVKQRRSVKEKELIAKLKAEFAGTEYHLSEEALDKAVQMSRKGVPFHAIFTEMCIWV